MDTWLSILSQPITQAGGIIAFMVMLQKAGLVDIRAMIRTAIGIDSGVKAVQGDSRDGMQTLLLKMEELTQYANHDTTKMHEITHEKLDQFNDTIRENTQILKEIKEYGIKCRD